jgi:hypothetical protein
MTHKNSTMGANIGAERAQVPTSLISFHSKRLVTTNMLAISTLQKNSLPLSASAIGATGSDIQLATGSMACCSSRLPTTRTSHTLFFPFRPPGLHNLYTISSPMFVHTARNVQMYEHMYAHIPAHEYGRPADQRSGGDAGGARMRQNNHLTPPFDTLSCTEPSCWLSAVCLL